MPDLLIFTSGDKETDTIVEAIPNSAGILSGTKAAVREEILRHFWGGRYNALVLSYKMAHGWRVRYGTQVLMTPKCPKQGPEYVHMLSRVDAVPRESMSDD